MKFGTVRGIGEAESTSYRSCLLTVGAACQYRLSIKKIAGGLCAVSRSESVPGSSLPMSREVAGLNAVKVNVTRGVFMDITCPSVESPTSVVFTVF